MGTDRQPGSPDDLHAVLNYGGLTRDLIPVANSCSWTTLAVGGFGSCTFDLEGWWTKDKVPYLATIKLYWGDIPLWEGRVEDLRYVISDSDFRTTVQCFGFQRLLTDTSVQQALIKADIPWRAIPGGDGITVGKNAAAVFTVLSSSFAVTIGNYDPTDLSKNGVQVAGKGIAMSALQGNGADLTINNGWTAISMWYACAQSGANAANIIPIVFWTFGSNAWNTSGQATLGVTGGALQNFTDFPGESRIRLGAYCNAGITPTNTDILQYSNLRLIGRYTDTFGLNFDDTGATTFGCYGGNLLRFILGLVPDLVPGTIDIGSDFIIQAITASDTRATLDVISEIVSYYAREWGVWEDKRFDWKTVNLDEPQWILDIQDLSSLELDTTTDTIAKTSYVLYTDAASGLSGQQSAVSSDQRNPFVKSGTTKDEMVQAGFPMTSNTAAQLAARLIADHSGFPTATGRLSLPVTAMVDWANGQKRPAAAIRGGDNVLLPGLPKSEPFTQGRDGQTLFHVVSTSADMETGQITLEVEGYTRTSDVLLARLAAVTRNITG
jgi:hypothetical protein